MLGFSSDGAFATTQSQFGLVSKDFIMNEVQCKGAERDIDECYHRDKHNCDTEEGAGVRCGVSPLHDDLREELKEIKDENEELHTKLSALMTKLNSLKISDQKQENRIEDNIQKLKSVSRHGKWCGYKRNWSKSWSVITYDSLKHSSSNMDITSTPLHINTGNYLLCYLL